MKILLIGDNRNNPNWGGRGASIALYQLLNSEHTVTDTLGGEHFNLESSGYGYVGTLTPARYSHWVMHAVANRRRRRLFDWYVRLEESFGANDFIQPRPSDTVNSILKYKEKHPHLDRLYRLVEQSDAVVINGEGDMVFTTPPRREALFLLGMVELADRLGKLAFFVNSIISDCPFTGRNAETLAAARETLAKCRKLVVRDPQSYDYVRSEIPRADCALVPDSLFTWYPLMQDAGSVVPANGDFTIPFPEDPRAFGTLDFSKPYICIGGSAASAREPSRAAAAYAELVTQLHRLGLPTVLCKNDGRDAFLEETSRRTGSGVVYATTPILMAGAIVANARVFISGRYHAAILASLGGSPSVFIGSTAHKMSSLQMLLEYPDVEEFSPFPSAQERDRIVEKVEDYLARGNTLRDQIQDTAYRRHKEALRLREHLKV